MGFFDRFVKIKERFLPDEPEEIGEEGWEEVTLDRKNVDLSDPTERHDYVDHCLRQAYDADRELESLQFEYNRVTSYLTDMEEIDAISGDERAELNACAKKLADVGGSTESIKERKSFMTDLEFAKTRRMEDEIVTGIKRLGEAEEYQKKIRMDLQRLDGEKHAYQYRKNELRAAIADTRGMTIICVAAFGICVFMLLILQYGFSMDIGMGMMLTALVAAIALTMVYVRYHDTVKELDRVNKGTNRLILLQNAVKIRYVNNTNLLDFLYMKYDVKSANQLKDRWEKYQTEIVEREKFRRATLELDEAEQQLLNILRRYRVKDPTIWLRQAKALTEPADMVEIRHGYIIQRQSLRRRMDYNREVVGKRARDEINELITIYPKYAKEILAQVNEYEAKQK